MPVSDEDLATQTQKVADLRDQVAQAKADRQVAQNERSNDQSFLNQQDEELRLLAELAAIKAEIDAEAAAAEADNAAKAQAIADRKAAIDAAAAAAAAVPPPPPEVPVVNDPPVDPTQQGTPDQSAPVVPADDHTGDVN